MKQFFFFFFFIISLFSNAQEVVVLDETNKEPLTFVNFFGTTSGTILSTNTKGVANISSLKNDSLITIQLLGYQNINTSYQQLLNQKKPILLVRSTFNLNPVVISANRWKQKKSSSPNKLASIDKKSIRFNSPQTAADLLSTNGEVFIQKSQQGGGSPIIRGFSTNRLLYSVDGVRMNTAIFRSGNLHNVISLDPFAIQNVEVLFGPGSILYGSDAIGGVMSFYTKTPNLDVDSFTVSGNASARYSYSNDELTAHLDIALQDKKWGLLSSFTITDYGDLTIGKNGPSYFLRDSVVIRFDEEDVVAENEDNRLQLPTAYSQQNFMQKVLYQPNKNLTLQYALHYSETSNINRYDRLIQKDSGKFSFAEWYYGPQIWVMNQLTVQYNKSTNFFDKTKINLAVQRFNESRNERSFGNDILRKRNETVDAYSINFDFYKKLNGRHELFYGLEAVLNTVESVGESENIVTQEKSAIQSRYPESDWYTSALYAKDLYTVNEKFVLETGLRLNDFGLKSTFDTNFVSLPFNTVSSNRFAINASFGGIYKAREHFLLRANISTGYRSPNVDDIGKFFDSEPGSIVIPNDNLGPEYAYNFDFGFTAIAQEKIKLDATVFYTLLDDALVRRNFQLNGEDSLFFDGENRRIQAIQNAATAFVWGLQVGLEYKFAKNLSFLGQLNLQKGEEELNDGSKTPSRHVVPTYGTARVLFEKEKWTLQLNLLASGSLENHELNIGEQAKPHLYALDESGNPYSPSWYTLSFRSQYKVSKVFSLILGLENITNQLYRPYSSGIAAAGRNLTCTANFNF